MTVRRRALSMAAIAALTLALVPTPVLAAAIGSCAPGAPSEILVGRGGVGHRVLPARGGGCGPPTWVSTVPVCPESARSDPPSAGER